MLTRRLFGTLYMAYHLRGQARYAFRPLTAIEADRDRRVGSIVAYAYGYVPYYRETMDRLGLRPNDFQTAGDLAKLPLLERAQVQRDPEYFVSTAQPLGRHMRIHNSGSTGTPCTFYRDARSLYQDAAHSARARTVLEPLLRRSVGYRKTMVFPSLGTADRVQQFYRENALLPRRMGLHRQQLSLLDPVEQNIALINEFKPDVIHTYGSYLAALFSHLQTTGQAFHRPKALLYTADALPSSARRLIQKEFGLPVFGIYEAVEAPNIGFECEQHSGLHLNIDLCPLRIVDMAGQTVPDGESGDVVVSDLINRATVVLNYRLNDIAALLPGPCPCGRSLPLLSPVQGRSDDWIELPSGKLVHPQVLGLLFKYDEHIWQWQVVQESPTHFRVALVTSEACDRQQVKERVAAGFASTFGEDTTVEIHFAPPQRTAAGKVRAVISLQGRGRFRSASHGPKGRAALLVELDEGGQD